MPKLKKEKLLAKQEFQRAIIDPSSINKEERRVSILISTENPIRRTDYWSGEQYDEVLLHGEENVDLTRAKTAKLRFMHGYGKYGELPIGKLENVRIENNELRADAIFSEANPDAEMFWQMVLEETLTEISVGGKKVEVRITEREGHPALVEVTRWEFHEASLVDIGADPAAGIGRSENNEQNLNRGEIMNQIEELRRRLDALKAEKADQAEIIRAQKALDDEIARVNEENKKVAEENAELKRQASIDSIVALSPGILDAEEVKRFKEDGKSTEVEVARAILAKQTEKQEGVGFQRGAGTPAVPYAMAGGDAAGIQRAIVDACVMRAGIVVAEPHKDAEVFRHASFIDIARAVTAYQGFNTEELISRAMSTSDFPNLLGNIANAILTKTWEQAESTYQLWVTMVEVKNFKENTDITPEGIGGTFDEVNEKGEKKSVEFGENAEKWKLKSYGEELKITREMIINDDFNYFQTVIQGWAMKAKRTVNKHVYDLLQKRGKYATYTMADGVEIFHADHKNVSAAGAALAAATLTAARTAMRRQTDAKGDAININPAFLFVGPEQESTAYQLLTSESALDSNNAGVKNPHKGTMTPIVDAEIDAAPWFIGAKGRTVKVGFLAGSNRMPIVKEKSRDLSGITLEVVFEFGVVAEDYRGLYKNVGA